jgi:glutamate--cysteine ligase
VHHVVSEFNRNFEQIYSWLETEKQKLQPLVYTSVDIRESDFKIASIDTNVFPAGFNNLNTNHNEHVSDAFKQFGVKMFPNATSILLFCEDHTRNTFYLDHIYTLSKIILDAGYQVTIGTFFKDHPTVCESNGYLDLMTASGKSVRIFCLNYILNQPSEFCFDFCILNNDLSDGNFLSLTNLNVPILPDIKMGWYHRKKSSHIFKLNDITSAVIQGCNLSLDPWVLSTLFKPMPSVNINTPHDQQCLADASSDLLKEIQQKYRMHGISSDPYLVLKSDNGTYGMGVISIKCPGDILTLNRKNRNKLSTGKSSMPIQNLIIQEGIPSSKKVNNSASEEVIYHMNGSVIGGFYRIHKEKSDTDILNSRGMQFQSFSNGTQGHKVSVPLPTGVSVTSYIIAQLANIAAQQELAGL